MSLLLILDRYVMTEMVNEQRFDRNIQYKKRDATIVFCLKETVKNWDALHEVIPFVQFQKHENQPWSSVTFSKDAGSLQL